MSRRTRTRIALGCALADLALLGASLAFGLSAAAIAAGAGLAGAGLYFATRSAS
jgi:hypothetical protein